MVLVTCSCDGLRVGPFRLRVDAFFCSLSRLVLAAILPKFYCLNNIAFAELKDTITIKDEKITVNRMEIQSNVLSMFVDGLYDLNGNGTDMSIQIPLSNLKKRNATYTPTNKGNRKDGGASVFIRAKPNDKGELKFSYDLFKRFRKK